MDRIHVYCVRERPRCGEPVCFNIGIVVEPGETSSSRKPCSATVPATEFTLGPFLDLDEAEHTASQLDSLLSRFRTSHRRYSANPLGVAGFWELVNAQILSIDVSERVTVPNWILWHGRHKVRRVSRRSAGSKCKKSSWTQKESKS